ncbi:MAG: aldo/keto reductase [Candidatus Hydrogenedentota bacterium]
METNRRGFLAASAAVMGSAVLGGRASAQDAGDGLDHRNERPDKMAYRQLGKTKFLCSRMVFGGGSALLGGRGVRLLEEAFENGLNFYDMGTDVYYKGAERNLAEFYKRHRGEIWVTSKAMVREGIRFRGNDPVLNVAEAKAYAEYWSRLLDQSLKDLGSDYVDAYYLMGVQDPEIVRSDELHNAFSTAKAAGKVGHFGISTHTNQQACLEAAIETGRFSLAMIAITPAGWFDLSQMKPAESEGGLVGLRPVLDRARNAGIGLIGMKAALYLAKAPYTGSSEFDDKSERADFYDKYYDEKFLQSPLSPFQRSYAYVLGHGVDVMNSDMVNFKHFEANIAAARTAHTYFA